MAFLLGRALCAQSAAPQFYEENYYIPERGDVPSFIVRIGRQRFHFLPPPGWQTLFLAAENKIVLHARDLEAAIEIRFKGPSKAPSDRPLAVDEMQAQLGEIAPGAVIHPPFRIFSADSQGTGFDLEQPGAGGLIAGKRVGFVNVGGFETQFVLMANQEKISRFYFNFQNLITTFHAEPPGGCRSAGATTTAPPPSRAGLP